MPLYARHGASRCGRLLVMHGSCDTQGMRQARRFAGRWLSHEPSAHAGVAFLSHARPSLREALDALAVHRHTRRIVVLPLFLAMGQHVGRDIPLAVEQARLRHPRVEFRIAPHVGADPASMANILRMRLETVEKHLRHIPPEAMAGILLAHGGKDPRTQDELSALMRHLRRLCDIPRLELACTAGAPQLERSLHHLWSTNVRGLVVLPHLLFPGARMTIIKQRCEQWLKHHPEMELRYTAPLASCPTLLSLLARHAQRFEEDI